MSVYRIMSSNKRQLNQLQEGLCYILIRDILIKLVLTLQFICQKNLNQFLLKLFTVEKQLDCWIIYKHPCMDICTFNDHYLNSLLDNLSKEANKTIVPLGDFNIDLLNFDTSEHVTTFLDNLVSNSLQPQILLLTRISNNGKTLIHNTFCNIPNPPVKGAMSGDISSSISDHLPQFFIIPEFFSSSSPIKYNIIFYD